MIILQNTGYACPEQYDAFIHDDGGTRQVGYLRLRHGYFSVECPDCGGELVLEIDHIEPDGRFLDTERRHYLNAATVAIERWLGCPKDTCDAGAQEYNDIMEAQKVMNG